jgi:large subunit ribosomal protein L4
MIQKVYDIEGNLTGEEVELPASVFEIEPNDHAIALAVTAEMTNNRQGNASTKNRKFVRGGGRKPWRQKGRGVARAGTIRSPIWRGGGTIFGPQPHDFSMRVNKKVKRLARRSALSYKAQEDKIRILSDFNWEDGKTAYARKMLKSFSAQKGFNLLLLPEYNSTIYQACRNIHNFEVTKAGSASTRQIVKSDTIFILKSALPLLLEVLQK